MLGFIRVSTRKPKSPTKKYLTSCARVIHASAVATLALSHTRVPYTNISGRPITNLEVFYTHWSYTATLEWSPTSALSVRAAVEYPAGTITPLYDSSGNRDIGIAGGGIGAALKASELNIPAGAVYYIRTRCVSAGGDGAIPRAYTHNAAHEGGTIQSYTAAANDGSDYTTSGNQPISTGAGYGPAAICSREADHKSRSFAIYGDSIARGSLSGGISFAETGIIGAGYSYINFSFSGAKIQSNTAMTKRRDLMKAIGVTDIVMNYPVNDLMNSRTVAQIQSDFNTLWANFKADGIRSIIQSTCLPKTVTDINTPDPVPTGAFTGGASCLRAQINAWFRSVAGSPNKPNYVFEFADVLESARDTGQWKDTTVTTDFLHPTAAGAAQAGNALTTALQGWGF